MGEKPVDHDDDTVRQRGAVTDYRPNDRSMRGNAAGGVQTEALGAEGSENLSATSATSGGAAGQLNDIDHNPTPDRAGGLNDGNRGNTR
jgi:hypothetical protein